MADMSVKLPLGPWSYPINQVARLDDLDFSLLSLAVVGDVLRVAGVVQMRGRTNLRLDRVPDLRLQTVEETDPIVQVGAHLMPHAGVVWVEWLFTRPARLPAHFIADISKFDLSYRVGGHVDGVHIGPVRFELRLSGDRAESAGIAS